MLVGIMKFVSMSEVEALRECLDFIRNGYVDVFSSSNEQWSLWKLRHAYNGNTLVILATHDYYDIKKNGEHVKRRFIKDDGSRYTATLGSDGSVVSIRLK